MNFIKMLSGDTEIIKHIYTEGDYVFSDITLKSEGFEEQTDGSRFRHVFNKGGKGARVFTDAPCDGEYYVALQVEDTFGTYDEEYIPVKDELCQPFEEKVTELEDEGVQCPGARSFEYAIQFNKGNYFDLPNKAAEIFAPVKCAVCGRGKGELPLENS